MNPAPNPDGAGGGSAGSRAVPNPPLPAIVKLLSTFVAQLRGDMVEVPPDHPAAIVSGMLAVAFVRATNARGFLSDGKLTLEFPENDLLVMTLRIFTRQATLQALGDSLIDWANFNGGAVQLLATMQTDGRLFAPPAPDGTTTQ